jgi:4-hydroxy-tetrahydrodipicolinate synthase
MFHGSIVALLTPMRQNGAVDYVCLRKLVDWHIAQGTDAIVVIGTTGEASTLSIDEQNNVIKTVVEQTNRSNSDSYGNRGKCLSISNSVL